MQGNRIPQEPEERGTAPHVTGVLPSSPLGDVMPQVVSEERGTPESRLDPGH